MSDAAKHEGHPVLAFTLVVIEDSRLSPIEALSFLVCAKCNVDFLRALWREDTVAIGNGMPDEYSPGDPDTPESHVVFCGFDWQGSLRA